MTTQAKYIMLNDDHFIIFPPDMNHKEIAERFPDHKCTSAGFIARNPMQSKLSCYGKSTSLDKIPAPLDETIINLFLRTA
jgi:hypothetical protein